MKLRWMIIIMLAVFLGGSAVSLAVIGSKNVTNVDVVNINEMLKLVEEQWDQLEQADFRSIEEKFTILDNRGFVLHQSDDGQPLSIYDAIKNKHIIVDVMSNDHVVGKLLIHNEDKEMIQQMKEQLSAVLLLMIAVISVLCSIYMLYIHHRVIKPFNRLQSFAVQIARGNLDVSLHMDKDNLFGAFTESFDIMREELAAARQGEYESNRSKKELVATLSHDIKTPVASIKAVSELMLLQAADDKVIKQLNMINSKAEQINLLISDMFHATMEELEELKVTVTEESSTVIVDMLANVNYDNQVSCERIPACIIVIDAIRLQQVLDNIMSNSYKYAGTSVTILSRISHGYLELDIMDYGKGIREDELPLLFNKFYRGSNVEGRIGSGLGLYISQYFMSRMGGDIAGHNRQDGFTVSLRMKLA